MFPKKTKLSGCEYKKRRLEKEKKSKEIAGSVLKFFKSREESPQPSCSDTNKECLNVQEKEDLITADTSNDSDFSNVMNEENSDISTTENIKNFDDPSDWPPTLSTKVIDSLIKAGPRQIQLASYRSDESGKSFSNHYYKRYLKNGEIIMREWLIYSEKVDSVFCFCCKLYSNIKMQLNSEKGVSDWKHISHILSKHETSVGHIECYKKWILLKQQLDKGTTIDNVQQKMYEMEEKHWYEVVQRMIVIIQFLAKNCLALRGSSNELYDKNNGNFLKAVEMVAKFDPVMQEHLRRIQQSKKDSVDRRIPHYLGNHFQNEIISLLADTAKEKILHMIKNAKYFSIILDATPDCSHSEQITMIFRFVDINNNKITVREHFLGFCKAISSTGEDLFTLIKTELERMNLDINNLRGQGYDNGSNMKGKNIGLQKRILDVNPRATFVPCAAHTLNLVVNDAAKINFESVGYFNLIQELYTFFSSSVYRWDILKKHVKTLVLQSVSETRWESRIKAIRPIKYNFSEVCNALLELENDNSRDIQTRFQAKCLYSKIASYKFILSTVLWYEVISRVNIVSKLMQNVKVDLNTCVEALKNLLSFFADMRTDEKFENFCSIAEETAKAIYIPPDFSENHRKRKFKKQFCYEHEDESIQTPKEKYKIEFYYTLIDTAKNAIEERFSQLNEQNDIFYFLYKIYSLNDDEVLKHCNDLYFKLKYGETSDIDALELFDEIKSCKSLLKSDMSPIDLLNMLNEMKMLDIFPNLTIALRIYLTTPVTVSTGERSFSKLKIIKNYLRSSMAQERLSNLSIIAIEQEIIESLDLDEIIKNFANKKARKVSFF